ncbi:hypothetical protein ACFXKW_20845 [Streptomyces sp. NPDC059193]|uniref:hypothetical protein n=1 Tax=Streptomyces sp. NPDC059193 TaxID=3346763 RepID=UPI0036C7BF9F
MTTQPPSGNGEPRPTVSGRVYSRTRPRGFAPWRPRDSTLVLVEQIRTVLEEYREHLPMTARQVFYRLVGAYDYPKTEAAYDRLTEHLGRARRARLIPMGAIRDDRPESWGPGGWADMAEFWESVRSMAEGYEHAVGDGQPQAVEVWIEASGMLPMVGRLAAEYGATAHSSGGFESVGAKHATAARIAYRQRPTLVLQLGDHDPSGLSMLDAAADDVAAFLDDIAPDRIPRFSRLAVTPDQIARYGLPTAPQKPADRRGAHMGETIQAEALAPDDLLAEVRAGLEAVTDADALRAARDRSAGERSAILAALDRLSRQRR